MIDMEFKDVKDIQDLLRHAQAPKPSVPEAKV